VGLLGQASVKLFASGFYALRDTRTPVRIAVLSLIVSAGLSWLLMRRLGPAGIALGSSLGATLNVILNLSALDRRIGTVLGGAEWRTLGVVVVAALAAAALAMAGVSLAAEWRPVPRGLAALGIFGVTYGALTLALRHPDALRSWQSLTGSRAS
jgi:putative peptidoglycan lipid II flippase